MFRTIDNLICTLIIALIAVMPLEHVPALRLSLIILLFLILSLTRPAELVRAYRVAWPLTTWAAFCGASLIWSVRPQSTFFHLKADLLPSLLAFGVLFAAQSLPGSASAVRKGILGCAIFNAMTVVFGFLVGMPVFLRYFADVGYSSTVAVICLAFSITALNTNKQDRLAVLVGALAIIAGVGSQNRMFFLLMILAGSGYLYLNWQDFVRPRFRTGLVVVLVGGILLGLLFMVVGENGLAGKFIRLFESGDSRPQIWWAWLNAALEYPVVGHGYGRNVGQYYFGEKNHNVLVGIDSFAIMHSHNIFLNSFFETGALGLLAFIAMLGYFLLDFLRGIRAGLPWSAIGMAILIGFLLKNQTDIFFLKSTMVMIFGLMGYCLAASHPTRRLQSEPDVNRRRDAQSRA